MKTDQPKQGDTRLRETKYIPEFYEIMVQGHLDDLWEQWFEGMTLANVENGESGIACTLISGAVADQSALHGLLIKICNLNLKLISVRRINPDKKTGEEIPIDSALGEE